MGINYFIDPQNLFSHEKYEKGIAQYVLKGKYVTDVFNYDERIFQKYIILGLPKPPETVILGTSKDLLIDSSFLQGSPAHVLNCAVSGAVLEDEMALYGTMIAKGWHPKKVILGVEPYFFNKNLGRNLYGAVRQYYYAFCDTLGIKGTPRHELFFKYGNYKQLISMEYFQKSLLFWMGTGNNHHYMVTDRRENKNKTRTPNGSIVYTQEYREFTTLATDRLAEKAATPDGMYFAENFKELSPDLKNRFEKFIGYLQSHHIQVEFVFTPYHPMFFDRLKALPDYHVSLEAEKYVRQFAKDKGIPLFGSIDPTECGMDHTDFYDEQHLKKEALVRILAKPLTPKGGLSE